MSTMSFLLLSRDFLPRPLRSAQNLRPPPRRAAQRTPAAKREQFHVAVVPLEFFAGIFFKKGLHLFCNRVILLIVHGDVAQLGERSVRIREVEGSSPFVSTILETASRCTITSSCSGFFASTFQLFVFCQVFGLFRRIYALFFEKTRR